jgi:argininosuccinate lyase
MRFTTGSSIMPQKKNPDVAELVRGKTGRVYGDLNALLTLMKGLPMTYNRDLQEDKEAIFDASDTVQLCLAVFAAMIPSIAIQREAMAAATSQGFMEATDLADYLDVKGVPFREAHGIIGRIVRHCVALKTTLPALPLADYPRFSPKFETDVYAVLTPEAIVRADETIRAAPRRARSAKPSKRHANRVHKLT